MKDYFSNRRITFLLNKFLSLFTGNFTETNTVVMDFTTSQYNKHVFTEQNRNVF